MIDSDGSPYGSERFCAFVHALRALCIEHKVCLSVSGYDGLQVWNLEGSDPPVYSAGIGDFTAQPPNVRPEKVSCP